jgi:tRNA(Arg) A34 adenosine deaminase TadA
MSHHHQKLIDCLIQAALKSDVGNKHSAAVISGNMVVSLGYNKHAKLSHVSTIHAEMDALYKIPKQFKKSTRLLDVFIIRVKVVKDACNGPAFFVLKNSKPCRHCLMNLAHKGIRRAFYSDVNGVICVEDVASMTTSYESTGRK